MEGFHVKTGQVSKLAEEKSKKSGRPAKIGTVGMYLHHMSQEYIISPQDTLYAPIPHNMS